MRTGRTGQNAGQAKRDMKNGTGRADQERQNRADRIGFAEQDIRNENCYSKYLPLIRFLLVNRLASYTKIGVCAILLRLYTSTEHLKRVYRSPEPLMEIDYLT
jgi:hypothetical protein